MIPNTTAAALAALPPMPLPCSEPSQCCYASAVATEAQNDTSYLAEIPIENMNLVGMSQGYNPVAEFAGLQETMAISNYGMEWTPIT